MVTASPQQQLIPCHLGRAFLKSFLQLPSSVHCWWLLTQLSPCISNWFGLIMKAAFRRAFTTNSIRKASTTTLLTVWLFLFRIWCNRAKAPLKTTLFYSYKFFLRTQKILIRTRLLHLWFLKCKWALKYPRELPQSQPNNTMQIFDSNQKTKIWTDSAKQTNCCKGL